LNPTSRFTPPGVRKIYWLPAIAAYATGATRTEINGGIDLTNEVAGVTGFTVASNSVEVPDLSSRFSARVPGRITAADPSSLMFYQDQTSNDVRGVLPRDTAGFTAFLWEGDISGRKYDIFPVKVSSVSPQGDMENPQQTEVAFSITRVPAQNLVVPP